MDAASQLLVAYIEFVARPRSSEIGETPLPRLTEACYTLDKVAAGLIERADPGRRMELELVYRAVKGHLLEGANDL